MKRYAWAILATEHDGRQTFLPPLPILYSTRADARFRIKEGFVFAGTYKSIRPVQVKVEVVERFA